jgi:hypothetical protein
MKRRVLETIAGLIGAMILIVGTVLFYGAAYHGYITAAMPEVRDASIGPIWNANESSATFTLVQDAASTPNIAIPPTVINPTVVVPAGTVSVGTMAGQALDWVVTCFAVPIGGLLSALLWRAFQHIGIQMTDATRERLMDAVVHALNLGAKRAEAELAGKGQITIKNATIAHAVQYVQENNAADLKALGVDPYSNAAVDRIKARIETAVTDVNLPTPKILDAPSPALPEALVDRRNI